MMNLTFGWGKSGDKLDRGRIFVQTTTGYGNEGVFLLRTSLQKIRFEHGVNGSGIGDRYSASKVEKTVEPTGIFYDTLS